MKTAKLISVSIVKDENDENVEVMIYKHENGFMFGIDKTFIDECFDSNKSPMISDPFTSIDNMNYPETLILVRKNKVSRLNISKKDFNETIRHELYTGRNTRINAMFYDWKDGYKYMVSCNTKNITKKDLAKVLYSWVVDEVQPPYYVEYRYAATDKERFKVSLSM